ncbi:MAG: amylo-alpha-1,6-glucosidase [Pyrinomonadaceae bacterium]
MIEMDEAICTDLVSSQKREWLETNGIGGYASSTVSGAHTRRYHALLVAATKPPLGRMALLSKYEETVIVQGERFELSTNQYAGAVHPEGYKFLTRFRLDPFPIWTYLVAGVEIERSVFMVHGEDTTVCTWKIVGGQSANEITLAVKPLVAFRDHHHLSHEHSGFDTKYKSAGNIVWVRPYAEMPLLSFTHNAVGVEAQGDWYLNFEYAIERERGFDHSEDLFQPFSLKFDLSKGAFVAASTETRELDDVELLQRSETERRAALVTVAGAKDDFTQQLTLAADQFIVARGTGTTVIAGYPWFSDWGRDTMIALNGLTLATNRPEIAKNILSEFSKHLSQGMLPNRFPDAGEEPEYNTVDATLWYFEAIRAYAEATGDYKFVLGTLYDKLVDVVDWHIRGTRYCIHVDDDGLLFSGESGVQLTWMDAKIGDWVVTPRTGKAVEIQALWYNALQIMADLSVRSGEDQRANGYLELAAKGKGSFIDLFWNADEQCLYDVINGDDHDNSVRPNQIFAVSLPYSMVDDEMARKVVDKVEAELLTPVGLRSISPADPRYVPVYIGSPRERDASYHQGTVWGWLIGGFVDAYRRTHPKGKETEKRVSEILSGFKSHVSRATVGQISEIFDADPPHAPRGCGAQAWSVAELLRVIRT